jgi:ComF family protein
VQLVLECMESKMEDYQGMIVPVPLHPRRLRQRGFNQAGLLARELGRRLRRTTRFDVLTRKQWTEPQTRLNREERLNNVKNAFQVISPGAIKGVRILLVDDVYTTGTTLSECARELKRSGAAEVTALTVTRAVPELNLLRDVQMAGVTEVPDDTPS